MNKPTHLEIAIGCLAELGYAELRELETQIALRKGMLDAVPKTAEDATFSFMDFMLAGNAVFTV